MNAEEKMPVSGGVWDWPNQQTVREDASGPGVDTTPGTAAAEAAGEDEFEEPTVEEMTKAQLLDYAAENDIEVDEGMTKAEIREAIADAET